MSLRDAVEALVVGLVSVLSLVMPWMAQQWRKLKRASERCEEERRKDQAERRIEQVRLSKMEGRYKKLLQFVTAIMRQLRTQTTIQVNAGGEVMVWDKVAEELFGWSNGEMMGKPISIIIPISARGAHEAAMAEAVREKRFIENRIIETEAVHKCGETFMVWIKLNTWVALNGEFYGAADVKRLVVAPRPVVAGADDDTPEFQPPPDSDPEPIKAGQEQK